MSKKYLVLGRFQQSPSSGSGDKPSPEQMQQMFAAFTEWKEKFKDNIVDMGDKLVGDGKVVSASGVVDGPYPEAKELIGGYMILAADSVEGAIEVVKASPMVKNPGASFEVRELAGVSM